VAEPTIVESHATILDHVRTWWMAISVAVSSVVSAIVAWVLMRRDVADLKSSVADLDAWRAEHSREIAPMREEYVDFRAQISASMRRLEDAHADRLARLDRMEAKIDKLADHIVECQWRPGNR
jgi:hypothetical protein